MELPMPDQMECSSKILKVLDILEQQQESVVLVSQYVRFLNLVEFFLKQNAQAVQNRKILKFYGTDML